MTTDYREEASIVTVMHCNVVSSDSDISDKILTHYYSNHNHPVGQGSLIEMTFVINKREFHRHVLTLI